MASNTPGYDPLTGLNTGDLGFSSPYGQNQYYNPNILFQTPFNGGYLDVLKGYDPVTNPTAYVWDPKLLTPKKIVYGSQDLGSPNSQATQTINGVDYNIGQNNYVAGQSYKPTPFQVSAPAVAQSTQAYSGPSAFMFGNNGSSGTLAGQFGQGAFYQNEPSTLTSTNPALGVLTPWNPGLKALQQNRTNP